jgi:hypothetical protein
MTITKAESSIGNQPNVNTGKRSVILFIILVIISFLIQAVTQNLILTDSLISEHLLTQMPYKNVVNAIELGKRWLWLNYVLIPIVYILKFALISFWILCGTIIFGFKTKFSSMFKIVVTAEFVWLLPTLLSIIWFSFFDKTYTFEDLQYFAPLSLLSLFDASQLDSWLIFPLKSLNLFEVIYILVLALGIKKIMKKDYDSALKFTLPVYGSALVVWILFVTFLSINLGA